MVDRVVKDLSGCKARFFPDSPPLLWHASALYVVVNPGPSFSQMLQFRNLAVSIDSQIFSSKVLQNSLNAFYL